MTLVNPWEMGLNKEVHLIIANYPNLILTPDQFLFLLAGDI